MYNIINASDEGSVLSLKEKTHKACFPTFKLLGGT